MMPPDHGLGASPVPSPRRLPAWAVTPGSARGGVNPLLVRDDVGKARPTCYDLPSDSFAYGRPADHDAEGAGKVMMDWATHNPSAAPEKPPNYLRFHFKATAAKVSSMKDYARFRREQELTLNAAQCAEQPRAKSGSPRCGRYQIDMLPKDMPGDFVFGRKVRPSTPVRDVVSYQYARDAQVELETFYDLFRQGQEGRKGHVRKIKMTNSARGHAFPAKQMVTQREDEQKELFKIKKFTKVSPKVRPLRKADNLELLDLEAKITH